MHPQARSFAIALLLLLPLAGSAANSRQIDFTVVLLDQEGEPMSECADPPDCKAKRAFTLGMAASRALLAPEQNLAPEESLKRGQLALSLLKATAAELTAEEIALLKKQIAKAYGPLVVARSFPLLDPAVK